MNDIVVEVRGGVVVDVYTSAPAARVFIVDWDDLEEDIGLPESSGLSYMRNDIGHLPPETRDCYERALRHAAGEETAPQL